MTNSPNSSPGGGQLIMCSNCGLTPCLCTELRDYAANTAHSLAAVGIDAATSGDYDNALTVLRAAISRGLREPWVFEAVGLSALGRGDIPDACQAWRQAIETDPNSPASEWLKSLNSGEVGSGLTRYNDALEAAKGGDYAAARIGIRDSRRILGNFRPSLELENLLASAQGPALTNPSRAAKIRPVAVALLIAGVAFLGGMSVRHLNIGKEKAKANPPVVVTNGNSGMSSKTERSDTIGKDSLDHPYAQTDRLRAARLNLALGRRGRDRVATQSVTYLMKAADLSRDSYLEDDALYELALAQNRAGSHVEASSTATRLLRKFPRSIFNNSTMKRLAAK